MSRMSGWQRAAVAAACLCFLVAGAGADPMTLRLASVGPEGTHWARELHSFAREIESATRGQVRVKWYMGGIAGDDPHELERVRHGQLDGVGGSTVCEMLAPSLAVLRVVGLFRSREEVAFVLGKLGPTLEQEFVKSGFHSLANSVFGSEVLFSQKPVRSMADFRALRWWTWSAFNVDRIWQDTMPLLGVRSSLATPIEQLASDLGQGRVDGFVAVPSVALAYQWTTLVPYVTELDTAMLPACLVVSTAALDPLPLEEQQAIRAAGAKLRVRWNDTTATLDRALLDGLLQKQGMKRVPVSPELRKEFYAAAQAAREKLGERLVPAALLARVEQLLAEFRAGGK
jgi:TRAP-type C4-dicarboxylate transport system substrate-binding protein